MSLYNMLVRYIQTHGPTIGSMSECFVRYTSFPYQARFLSAERKNLMISEYIKRDENGNLKRQKKIIQNSTCVPDSIRLRYCPECVRQDIAQFGEPYWHRSHQMKVVKCCHKHGCELQETGPIYSFFSHEYPLCADDVVCCVTESPRASKTDRTIAEGVYELLNRPFTFADTSAEFDGVRLLFLTECIKRGYDLNGTAKKCDKRAIGRGSASQMFDDMVCVFGEKYLYQNGFVGDLSLLHALRSGFSVKAVSTTMVLILAVFFGVSVTDLMDASKMKELALLAEKMCASRTLAASRTTVFANTLNVSPREILKIKSFLDSSNWHEAKADAI